MCLTVDCYGQLLCCVTSLVIYVQNSAKRSYLNLHYIAFGVPSFVRAPLLARNLSSVKLSFLEIVTRLYSLKIARQRSAGFTQDFQKNQ